MPKKSITKLEHLHKTLRDKRKADRVKAIIALAKGWTVAQVAEILLIDENTSRTYFDRYQQAGSEALLADNHSGAVPKLDSRQMKELEHFLEEHLLMDTKLLVGHERTPLIPKFDAVGIADDLNRLGNTVASVHESVRGRLQ